MSKITKPLSAIVAALFPKSQKAVSEKLSTDEFNEFAGEANEIQNRLDAQAEGNTQEQTDRKTAEARVTELEAQLATAGQTEANLREELKTEQGKVTSAQAEIITLKASVQEKDDYITKLKQSVNPLGEEDASNQASDDFLTDTDREARAAYGNRTARPTVAERK